MHNLLPDEAHRFFLENVKPIVSSYKDSVSLLENEYSSVVRQTSIKNFLRTSRVEEYFTPEPYTAAAISTVCKRITSFPRHVTPSHRGNDHRSNIICSNVIGCELAEEALGRIGTKDILFLGLYAELEISVQIDRKKSRVFMR